MKAARLLVAIALLTVACGDTGATTTSAAAPSPAPTSAPAAASAPTSVAPTAPAVATPTTTRPAADPAPEPVDSGFAVTTSYDGPPAPDFALTLENRDFDFQLSDEQNPVYMVFWAEW